MSSEPQTPAEGLDQPHPTVASQVFRAQRTASRRLCMQFLYALDAKNAAMQNMRATLAELPARIAEALADEVAAEKTPPPRDEEGNPVTVAKATVPLSEQLQAEKDALETFLANEPSNSPAFAEESLEAFFTLAEELW
ncbi:MAG: hypothetical protein J6Y80_03030, partial [Victivallales bacterium]|nr:hypothetical protein [Victivallales bacterium]